MGEMISYSGSLRKMKVELSAASTANYLLNLVNLDSATTTNTTTKANEFKLNNYLNQKVSIEFLQQINCINCGRSTKKSYSQGHCYVCSQKLASCDYCILKPSKCHFAQNTCREPEWGLQHCFVPHIVYLANTSGVKVGITRETQVPIRWIDQGAVAALPIMRVQSRYQSGLLEEELANYVADKTNWRTMLKGNIEYINLSEQRDALLPKVAQAIGQIAGKFTFGDIELLTNEQIVEINYPVEQYPEKVKSLNLDKQPLIEGVLQGIKGQYLILDCGVINLRNFTGYQVKVSLGSCTK